jgi:hypothetical protein
VGHLRASGFATRVELSSDLRPLKARLGVPRALESCHTALVGAYVIEGHVPAATIKRLLRERPAVTGLAVPGMPVGSPGMEVPGHPTAPYHVLTFDKAGRTMVFETR